jgi:hypothetical protein
MQRYFVFLLIFSCAAANAQVFKRTGPDGKVYFSDQPGADAVEIQVAPVQTISAPPVPTQTEAAEANDDPVQYREFSILSPTAGEAIRSNNGNITVRLSLQPGLKSGHRIELTIDGEDGQTINSTDGMTIELSNLSRGLHTIAATVVDHAGNALAQAEPVSFHVLRVALGGG